MKARITVGIFLIILTTSKLVAQSLPLYSNYMFNMSSINPAFAGTRGVGTFTGLWRQQWSGLPGSPTTKSISYDNVSDDEKVGYGVQVFDDKYVNYINRTGVNLMYNLKIKISDEGVLSLGLKGGIYNDVRNLNSVYLGSSASTSLDNAFASNLNKIVPLAGAGLFYNNQNFYFGISVPDIILFSKVTNYKSDASLYQVNELHYFITSGYNFEISDEVSVKPSFLIKASSGAPLQADFNTNVWLNKIVGLGASYRTSESILGLAELQITPQMRFGYAYDMPFNRPNSHELLLRYELGNLYSKGQQLFKLF
jgi:type IX secretion system PorP/SprF family membrane protein